MIINIGNDIIEVDRIRDNFIQYGKKFLDRILAHEEQDYCLKFADPAPRIAGRFAAKEAIAKALGTGFGDELVWLDITIQNERKGNPIVTFSHKANIHFNNPRIMLSISHCKKYATAVAILLANNS